VNIKIGITAEKFDIDTVGLSKREVDKINRAVGNKFLKRLDTIPRRIATENDINMTGFKRVRARRTRLLVKNRARGSFWIGENAVLAQYVKVRARKRLFTKDVFLMPLKNGKSMMFTRKSGKLEPVVKQLRGYEKAVADEVKYARRPVLADYAHELKLTFGGK